MQQIVESVTNTAMKFAHDYGMWVAVGVLAVVGAGIALRVIGGILPRGRAEQGK
jgi:hypothetical protein